MFCFFFFLKKKERSQLIPINSGLASATSSVGALLPEPPAPSPGAPGQRPWAGSRWVPSPKHGHRSL